MDSYRKLVLIFYILTTYKGAVCGTENQDAPIGALAEVMNTVNVYMAEEQITVGDTGLEYVEIMVIRSGTSNQITYINLQVDDDDSRYAYVKDTYLEIYQGETNTTTQLQFPDYDNTFYTEDSTYNITITSCSPDCGVTDPQSTIVTIVPDKNVSVYFGSGQGSAYEDDYCSKPMECSYGQINIMTSLSIQESILIPLKIDNNSTATYLDDYFFDLDPPAVNISGGEYHYLKVYIKHDEFVEGTEYIYLSIDEENLPARFIVGQLGSTELRIYDDDYGKVTLKGANRNVSEDIGTVDIVVETNFVSDTDIPVEIRTYDGEGATPGEDFEPFDGTYYIPAGMNNVTIQVTIIDDDLAENPEYISFNVEVYYEPSGDVYHEYGHLYIDDDETRNNPLVFSFDKTSAVANESSGTLEFLITANIKNNAYVLLEYLPAEENGLMEYLDYSSYFNDTIRRNVFRFEETTEKLITVDIIDDCEIEEDEELTLNISLVSIGSAHPTMGNVTITVEDNDEEGELKCAACACGRSDNDDGDGMRTTDEPTTAEPDEEEPLTFNFQIDEFDISEGDCSFYDLYVTASQPTDATVFIGVQPYELDYGSDFTISAKKLVFKNNDRLNFSFRALQDDEEEDVESTLLSIAYTSEGMIGRWNVILVHVWNENATMPGMTKRFERSVADQPSVKESRAEEFESTAITTGLVAGLVSSVFVVVMTTILFGLAVIIRKQNKSS